MTNIGSKRRTAPHSGRNNAAKRAAAAANKKRANRELAIFLQAMTYVTPYRKNLERKDAFNNIVKKIRNGEQNIGYRYRNATHPKNLGLSEQQWYAFAGVLNTIHRHPNLNVVNALAPISARVRANRNYKYTNANRKKLIAWARSR
jgi:hypothetical protein